MKTLTHIFVSILRDDVGIVPYKIFFYKKSSYEVIKNLYCSFGTVLTKSVLYIRCGRVSQYFFVLTVKG